MSKPLKFPCAFCQTLVPAKSGTRVVLQVVDRSSPGYGTELKLNMSLIYCNDSCAELDAVARLTAYFEDVGKT